MLRLLFAPLKQFYLAEDCHQNYTWPAIPGNLHDMPKLEQLRERFPSIYR